MQRATKASAFAALFVVTAALATFSPSQAATACGTPGNFFAGGGAAASSAVRGSSARIEYNNPDLCGNDTTGGSFSVAWAMVTAPSLTFPTNSAAQGWAQTGYGQFAHDSGSLNEGIHPFAQYSLACRSTLSCLGDTVDTYLAPGGVTSLQTYSNVWESANGHVHMRVGSTQLLETYYNPVGLWKPEWRGEFAGEVGHAQSDVPGVSSDITTFDYLKKFDAAGASSFYSSVSMYTPTSSRHHVSSYAPAGGGPGLKIWTAPLS